MQQQQPPAHEKRSKIWIILITLWIINGSSFLAIKLTIDTIPPLLSAGIRFTIAGLVLFSIYYIRGGYKRERKTKQQWKHALILGLTLFLGGQGVLTWGAQYLSSGITGLLNSTVPLWLAIVAYLIYRKHLSNSTMVGLGAGFGGLMLLVAPFHWSRHTKSSGYSSANNQLCVLGPGFALFIKGTVASKHTSFLCDGNDFRRLDAYGY